MILQRRFLDYDKVSVLPISTFEFYKPELEMASCVMLPLRLILFDGLMCFCIKFSRGLKFRLNEWKV